MRQSYTYVFTTPRIMYSMHNHIMREQPLSELYGTKTIIILMQRTT